MLSDAELLSIFQALSIERQKEIIVQMAIGQWPEVPNSNDLTDIA